MTTKPAGPLISFTDAMDDPMLFGSWFTPAASWATWRIGGKAIFAEPMTPVEAVDFTKYTGRRTPPTEPPSEAWLACGRRAVSMNWTRHARCPWVRP